MDDGTTAHLTDNHFIMSTTTANAGKVMQHLEHARQVIWPDLDVDVVSVTEQWSQYAIAGPRSRTLLELLIGDCIDVSDGALPFLACREFSWRGIPARVFRVSFSGELAYELSVPANFGDAAIRYIEESGRQLGLTPYGTEAMAVMRIEKGHVAGGELNGMTTAGDLGLGRMLSTKKDFIGSVLSKRPALMSKDRPSLIGVRPVQPGARLNAGAHFLNLGAAATLANDQGYLTSVAYSPNVGSWIGLGLLVGGQARIGQRVRAYDPVRARDTEIEVCSSVFIDPTGEKLRG